MTTDQPKKTHKLVIEVDEDSKTISITTETGERFFLESLVVFGGNAVSRELFIRMHGSGADAAWAYGRGFVMAHSEGGGREMKNFYKQCAAHVCHAIDPHAFQQEVGADEVLNKWECQDQSKWALWDTEDVLRDKAKAETRKKLKVLGPTDIIERFDKDEEDDPTKWN